MSWSGFRRRGQAPRPEHGPREQFLNEIWDQNVYIGRCSLSESAAATPFWKP